MKKTVVLCVALLAMAGALTTGQQAERPGVIPGQYIVVFKDTVPDAPGLAYELARSHGATPRFVYEHAIRGFAAALPEQAAEALSHNPNVAYVEPDSVVWAFETQTPATWGLDRIDQRALPLNNTYTFDVTGTDVTVYVIDTGIRLGHSEFEGRAASGFDAIDGGEASDANGHGTHVAGTIGGRTYGVAKKVRLIAVRVLDADGSGTTAGVIAGIDWVTANHSGLTAVANMSLGGGASATLDTAVRNSIADGVAYAVAAGNGNFIGIAQNACNYSPARVAEAMTVSATDSTDKKASWANYGDCVDWFAPGVGITSAWLTSDTATNTISGTSMATPHTAGVAALYLQTFPSATPQQVRDALYEATTKGIVLNSKTANNHLLYSLFGGTTDNNPPAADFTSSANGLTVTFTDESMDTDGNVVSWSWNFGDGATSTAQNPSHIYAAAGTYPVTLTVTDDDGANNTISQSVTVTSGSSYEITLTVVVRVVRGVPYADLAWTDALGAKVNIYRDASLIASTTNDGFYTDNLRKPGFGTFVYRVCETDGTPCSNLVSVTISK